MANRFIKFVTLPSTERMPGKRKMYRKATPDFVTKKRKVGKSKKDGANVTEISFKSRSVVVPPVFEQSSLEQGPTTHRKQSLQVKLLYISVIFTWSMCLTTLLMISINICWSNTVLVKSVVPASAHGLATVGRGRGKMPYLEVSLSCMHWQ